MPKLKTLLEFLGIKIMTPQPPKIPDDDFGKPPSDWGMWVMGVVFVIPWLVGLGAIFNYLFDGMLW